MTISDIHLTLLGFSTSCDNEFHGIFVLPRKSISFSHLKHVTHLLATFIYELLLAEERLNIAFQMTPHH